MEGGALLVQRQRLAGASHPLARQGMGGEFERPDEAADAARHLVQRRAVGGDRIPHADEMDFRHLPVLVLVVVVAQEQVADPAENFLDAEDGVVALAPVGAVGGARLVVELLLVARRDQALVEDQAADDAHGEGAAAEAEAEEAVAVVAIVTAGEFVDVDDVALQPDAEGAGEDRPRLERGRADAVVVEGDLVAVRQFERLERAPDIGAPDLRAGIAGAVGQKDDVSAHGQPLSYR